MQTESWFEFLKAYGLGVATLGISVWWLVAQLKAAKEREVELVNAVIELTRESLSSMAGVSKVIDALTPTIGQVSAKQQADLSGAVVELKSHITDTTEKVLTRLQNR